MALDAFGRLRTSDCFTTFNYYPSLLSNNTTLDIDVWVSGQTGGAQSYNSQNYINMPLSGSGVTYSIRTTKQPMIYQPGKSRLIYMTGVLMTSLPPTPGTVNSHMGIFNVDNTSPSPPNTPVITQGTYLRCDGGNLYWEDVMQGPTTISVVQTSWNIDTFNGSGPSGKTLTVTNATQNLLIVIDQEWLGVGRIRCGFIIDGIIYYAHQFLHNAMTIQYTNTPRLNLSYYITSLNVSNAMRQMCSTNILEGGYFTTGRINSVTTPFSSFVTMNSTNNFVLLAMRVSSSFPYATFFTKAISLYFTGGGGKYAEYTIQLHSTNGSIGALTGAAPSFTNLPNSSIQYYIGNGTVYVSTNGFIIGSGYIDTSSNSNISLSEFDSLQTHQLFTQYDTLIVTGIANSSGGAAGTMGASITFIEDN
jgi:hypothetical protein